jgi:hypothetical protein
VVRKEKIRVLLIRKVKEETVKVRNGKDRVSYKDMSRS